MLAITVSEAVPPTVTAGEVKLCHLPKLQLHRLLKLALEPATTYSDISISWPPCKFLLGDNYTQVRTLASMARDLLPHDSTLAILRAA